MIASGAREGPRTQGEVQDILGEGCGSNQGDQRQQRGRVLYTRPRRIRRLVAVGWEEVGMPILSTGVLFCASSTFARCSGPAGTDEASRWLAPCDAPG